MSRFTDEEERGARVVIEAVLKVIAGYDFRLNVVKEVSPTGDDYNELGAMIEYALHKFGIVKVDDVIATETQRLQDEHDANGGRTEIMKALASTDLQIVSCGADAMTISTSTGKYRVEVTKLT